MGLELDCLIRPAINDDAEAISQVVIHALRGSNAQDYSAEIIAQVERSFSPASILQLLTQRQVYVATSAGQVVATASLDRDVVRSVFVDPACQGLGAGKMLMATLQSIAADQGLSRLRVPSSITAEGFYAALGFEKVRDEYHGAERTIIMEKRLGP
jgi:N-acetylglutamate synthase-like GNAT family acetyltransferase